MSNKLPSVHLEFIGGTSFKEYNVAVEETGNNSYVVNFSYGRIGGTLSTGSKTSSPVSFEAACKIYTALVRSKTAKGYKEVSGGTGEGPSSGTGYSVVTDKDKVDTGLRPQLLNPITEEQAEEYITDDDFACQEKYDGRRLQFRKTGGLIIAANKLGWKVGFPKAIQEQLAGVDGNFEVDGECVGETLYLFDILLSGALDVRGEEYHSRLQQLQDEFTGLGPNVVVAPTAIGTKAKRALLKQLREQGKEGIVFKRLDAAWYAGRPNSGGAAFKCKFYATASVIVASHTKGKHSIGVRLGDRDMGNVTVAQAIPLQLIGSVAEIRYLYVNGLAGKFYQPVYLGPRDDIDPSECTIEKQHLKYKGEETFDEDELGNLADGAMEILGQEME